MQAALVPMAQVSKEFNTGFNLENQIRGMQQAFHAYQNDVRQLPDIELFHTHILLSRIIGLPSSALSICKISGAPTDAVERQIVQRPGHIVMVSMDLMLKAMFSFVQEHLPQYVALWPEQATEENITALMPQISFPVDQYLQQWTEQGQLDIRCALLVYFKMMWETDAKPYRLGSQLGRQQQMTFNHDVQRYIRSLDEQPAVAKTLYS